MNVNDYEKLIAERAAEVRYHVEHIKVLHAGAEAALLIWDEVKASLCLAESKRHLDELEKS